MSYFANLMSTGLKTSELLESEPSPEHLIARIKSMDSEALHPLIFWYAVQAIYISDDRHPDEPELLAEFVSLFEAATLGNGK